MSLSRIVAFACPAMLALLVSVEATARPYGLTRDRFVVSAWRVTLETDRFTGTKRCRLALRNGKAVFDDQAVMFDMPNGMDVSETTVRIDEGAPIRWRDLIPDLAIAMADPLRHAAEGRVPIPVRLIDGSNRVAIAPGFGRKPRMFVTNGFEWARRHAGEAGCTPDAVFVR